MLNIKRLSIEPIWELPDEMDFMGILIDSKSAEILYKMEALMERLEVMGNDNRRFLWLDFQGPTDFEEYPEDFDSNGIAWFEIMTSQYNGIHYLDIANGEYKLLRFKDKKKSEFEEKTPCDISEPLAKIAKYLEEVVDMIVVNPDAYNDYVAKLLPYSKRTGVISRRELNNIMPTYRIVDNPEPYIKLLEEMNSNNYFHPEKLSINTYAHYWRIGYEASVRAFSKSPQSFDSSDVSDMDFFCRPF